MSDHRPSAVIVLAAGEGTRMKSAQPKVLHAIAGRSLLGHAIAAARGVEPAHLAVVVRHAREQVASHVQQIAPDAVIADQDDVKGTGRATECGLDALRARHGHLTGTVLVTYGDVPLLEAESLRAMVAAHEEGGCAVSVITAHIQDPTGYGRIVRDAEGQVCAIVEQKDASDEQRRITEINSGIYAFDGALLADALAHVGTDNAQGEKYLTDVVGVARGRGLKVGAHVLEDLWQTEGVNDRVQLARLGAELNRRLNEKWMRAGVTIVDPATTWIDAEVSIGRDTIIEPGTQLLNATSIGSEARIGPEVTLDSVEVGDGASVRRSEAHHVLIGQGASVGPFSYLRPGTVLGRGAKVGGFVETKNAKIGDDAKVPHLTYCGDATIREGANIGAGTIFANYDGVTKAPTTIGRHSFVGSQSVLVAPVEVGDGAYVAAGSTVVDDVEPGQIGVARARQRNIPGWVQRRRSGTKSAAAAESALAGDDAGTSAAHDESAR